MIYRLLKITRIWKFLILSALLMVLSGCAGDTGEDLLERGLTQLSDGDTVEAAALLERAAETLPDNASLYCNLGIAYWHLKQHDRAVQALQRGAELSSSDAEPFEFLGHVFIDAEEWTAALEAFEHAMDRTGRTARVLTSVAVIKLHTEDLIEARMLLSEALKADPFYTPALYNMAVLYRDRAKNAKEASKYFQRFVDASVDPSRIGPPVDDTYLDDAEMFLGRGERGGLKPETENLSEGEGEEGLKPETGNLSEGEREDGLKPEAGNLSETESTDEAIATVQGLLAEAESAIEKDEFVIAKRKIKDARELAPDSPDPLWQMAVLYDKHLDYAEKAETLYREFKNKFPDDRRSKLIILPGNSSIPVKVSEKDAPLPEAVVRTDSDVALAKELFDKAFEAHQTQDWDAAIAYYKKAYEHDDRLHNAVYNMGLAYKKKGDLDSAKRSFEKSTIIQSGELKAWYMLSIVRYELKEFKQAILSAERVLEINPSYGKAHFLLGLLHSMQGRPDLAKGSFSKCIECAPGEALAAKAREHLNELP